MLTTIDVSHSLWSKHLRLVADAVDHALATESGTVGFAADPVLQFGTFQKDDTGRVSTSLTLGNDNRALDAWFSALKGSAEQPIATLRWYDDDGYLLLGPVIAYLYEPTAVGATVTAELRSRTDEDLPASPAAFTLENTPTLRGLRT